MKRFSAMCAVVAMMSGCAAAQAEQQVREIDLDVAQREIDAAEEALQDEGRMPRDFNNAYMVLGQYGWHKQGSGFSGRYTLHAAALAQAKRSWWIHGFTLKGSTLLYATNRNANFDDSIVGHTVSYTYVDWTKGTTAGMTTTVVETLKYDDNSGHKGILRLKHAAPVTDAHYSVAILPPDYVDMCGCTVSEGAATFKKAIGR